MAANSKIEWTDHTWNPWIGCTKVAPGCTHCYAESYAKRYGKAQWGPNGSRVKTSEAYWRQPLKWNREAEKSGKRDRVFCASLADVFEDWPWAMLSADGTILGAHSDGCLCPPDQRPTRNATMDDVRRQLFSLIDATPWLDWLLLTKRPESIRRLLMPWLHDRMGDGRESPDGVWRQGVPVRNLWLGTSVSEQETADWNIPLLLACRELSPVLFVSAEPLLGAVNLLAQPQWFWAGSGINWVIVGGESGPHARPMHPAWARGLRDQCVAAGVAYHFKQNGEFASVSEVAGDGAFHYFSDGATVRRVGKKAAGRLLDGRTWDEFPEVRQ